MRAVHHPGVVFERTVTILVAAIAVLCLPSTVRAAELKKDTATAFDRYISATESRMSSDLKAGVFLYVDGLAPAERTDSYERLRRGEVLLKHVDAVEEGRPIEVPHGLIHDWVGVVFIPGAKLAHTLAVVQDYDHHQKIYKPEVRRSKLISREGDRFQVFLQFYKKSLVTVALNVEFDVRYEQVAENRVLSRSVSTRIAEITNPGEGQDREYPVNGGHGYLWRLNNYWRAEEKDGGVYVQMESIGLSRGVPAVFAWMVNPLLRSIPRGSLASLLEATRKAVLKPAAKPEPVAVLASRPVRTALP